MTTRQKTVITREDRAALEQIAEVLDAATLRNKLLGRSWPTGIAAWAAKARPDGAARGPVLDDRDVYGRPQREIPDPRRDPYGRVRPSLEVEDDRDRDVYGRPRRSS